MTDSHVVAEHPCPCCGYVIDRAANAQGEVQAPVKGDFSVCVGCAVILVFDECAGCGAMGVRLPVIEEAMELEDQHPEVAKTLAQHQLAVMDLRRKEDPTWVPDWMKGLAQQQN